MPKSGSRRIAAEQRRKTMRLRLKRLVLQPNKSWADAQKQRAARIAAEQATREKAEREQAAREAAEQKLVNMQQN